MDTAIRQMWVNALRSGVYQQGHGLLGDSGANTYCCLGVLCEIAASKGVTDRMNEEDSDRVTYGPDWDTMTLPVEVMEWADLSSTSPVIKDLPTYLLDVVGVEDASGYPEKAELTELNDDYGFTFEQIADIIEAAL